MLQCFRILRALCKRSLALLIPSTHSPDAGVTSKPSQEKPWGLWLWNAGGMAVCQGASCRECSLARTCTASPAPQMPTASRGVRLCILNERRPMHTKQMQIGKRRAYSPTCEEDAKAKMGPPNLLQPIASPCRASLKRMMMAIHVPGKNRFLAESRGCQTLSWWDILDGKAQGP